jgi:hypothetical protein
MVDVVGVREGRLERGGIDLVCSRSRLLKGLCVEVNCLSWKFERDNQFAEFCSRNNLLLGNEYKKGKCEVAAKASGDLLGE